MVKGWVAGVRQSSCSSWTRLTGSNSQLQLGT